MRDVVLKSALLETGDDVQQRRGREQGDDGDDLSEWKVEEGNDGGREGRRVIIISAEDGRGPILILAREGRVVIFIVNWCR